jgi:hypothetical protein
MAGQSLGVTPTASPASAPLPFDTATALRQVDELVTLLTCALSYADSYDLDAPGHARNLMACAFDNAERLHAALMAVTNEVVPA